MGLPRAPCEIQELLSEAHFQDCPPPAAFGPLRCRHLGELLASCSPCRPGTVSGTEWVLSKGLPCCFQRTWCINPHPAPLSQAKEDQWVTMLFTPSRGISTPRFPFLYRINTVGFFGNISNPWLKNCSKCGVLNGTSSGKVCKMLALVRLKQQQQAQSPAASAFSF